MKRNAMLWAALLSIAAIASCGKEEGASESAPEAAGETHGAHEHVHAAPHGGTLVVLGDEFAHVEFVYEPAAGKLTAYVLDGEAESPIRLSQAEIPMLISTEAPLNTVTLKLKPVASELTGETVGDTSQFEITSIFLENQERFGAVIKEITVRGQTFTDVSFDFPEGKH